MNFDHIIVSSDKITEHLTEWANDKSDQWTSETGQQKWADRYRSYKRESVQEVNYMVKEFEMKKSEYDLYRRSSTSKTGVLDTSKLHTYKFNDDIFKKVTSVTEGKNHGLVFYVDWSGSMAHVMEKTIRQMYSLFGSVRRFRFLSESMHLPMLISIVTLSGTTNQKTCILL